MAKKEIPSIADLSKYISKEKTLPVYFLCGEDQFTIDASVEIIEKHIAPQILSDFDKEMFSAEKGQNLSQILDVAFAFPFGGGKKLIIIKNFEKFNDKKELNSYLNQPPDSTVLVITQSNKVTDIAKEPYSILLEKHFMFEARSATSEELVDWVIRRCKKVGINFSRENAQSLVDIVGEDKALLDMQLQKFENYFVGKNEISFEDIKINSSPTKEYSIFSLQDALGQGDKVRAVEIAFNLLDSGVEIVFIINMLAKFTLTIAQMTELLKLKISDFEAAKQSGVSYGYYMNTKRARFLMDDKRLLNASRALLNADLLVKTTATDHKTILLVLISEMLGQTVASVYEQ